MAVGRNSPRGVAGNEKCPAGSLWEKQDRAGCRVRPTRWGRGRALVPYSVDSFEGLCRRRCGRLFQPRSRSKRQEGFRKRNQVAKANELSGPPKLGDAADRTGHSSHAEKGCAAIILRRAIWFLRRHHSTIQNLPILSNNSLNTTDYEVFRYGVATGRAENDPTSALRGALTTPVVRHRAAIVEPKAFGGLLRSIDGTACLR